MNKILVKLQGKTLILHYQVNPGVARADGGGAAYIDVRPCAELSRFNLKGLTPEMFCVNISDLVNLRGQVSGVVENEQQAVVAHWEMNEEAYRLATSRAAEKLTHRQIVGRLETLPGYVQELDGQFIDFEASVAAHGAGEPAGGYRLTIVTEDMGDRLAPYAFYNLDTRSAEGWLGIPPPTADFPALRDAFANKLQAIRGAGVTVTEIFDETDYATGQ
ncbi:MAG: hypothetical protein KGZ83_07620 [Sulfuricella sp.]|nr:hypothetical protein [Sulfuricella sp.]